MEYSIYHLRRDKPKIDEISDINNCLWNVHVDFVFHSGPILLLYHTIYQLIETWKTRPKPYVIRLIFGNWKFSIHTRVYWIFQHYFKTVFHKLSNLVFRCFGETLRNKQNCRTNQSKNSSGLYHQYVEWIEGLQKFFIVNQFKNSVSILK